MNSIVIEIKVNIIVIIELNCIVIRIIVIYYCNNSNIYSIGIVIMDIFMYIKGVVILKINEYFSNKRYNYKYYLSRNINNFVYKKLY